jgi:hypothetical protein
MIYSVNFTDLTEQINPLSFARYLKETGWTPYTTKRTYLKIFQTTTANGDAFQVTIPLDKSLSDYKSAMFQAVETVAFVEKQSTEQLILFLLNPNTDILKIRLDRKDIEAGNILLDDAINIYENAKKLIAATAQDILHPKRYHQGRYDESVNNFISHCKFGQTEIGSYIVSVVCPFAELDESEGYRQLSIFSDEDQCAESLTRKVTNRIMNNVSSIKSNIDNGDLDKLIAEDNDEIISANFYEALTGLNLNSEDANLEFIAQWSPVVKKNRCQYNRVLLSHDYYEPLSYSIGKLRQTTNTKSRILGRIKKLESSPDLSKRTSGKITVVYLDENEKKRTVTVHLNKEDYDKAITAHGNGNHVEIIGEIANSGARNIAMTCESFNIIE